jgi:hypothetical protein
MFCSRKYKSRELSLNLVKTETNRLVFCEMIRANFDAEDDDLICTIVDRAYVHKEAYLIINNGTPIGTICIKKSGVTDVWCFSINRDMRKQGFGNLIMKHISKAYPKVRVSIDKRDWKYDFYSKFDIDITVNS